MSEAITAAPPSPPLPEAWRTPAIVRSSDHRYTFEGETYPGVTGVLAVLDKSGPLMRWASRETAKASIAQLDNLPSLLETVGPEGVIKALTSRSTWQRDEAASLGEDLLELPPSRHAPVGGMGLGPRRGPGPTTACQSSHSQSNDLCDGPSMHH